MSAWADARREWKDAHDILELPGDDFVIPDAPFYIEDI